MKEIGKQFKEKREEIGISVQEVANDLHIDAIIIENLEDGNNKVFKDILELKDIIEQYIKYLGLDEKKIMDQVDDYLFEKTSKINLDDIKEEMNKRPKEEKKIRTPYTIEHKKKKSDASIFIICIIIAILLVVFYLLLRKIYIG